MLSIKYLGRIYGLLGGVFLLGWFMTGCSTQAGRAGDVLSTAGDTLLDINGTSLYVRTIGEGTPIIFLHGGPGMEHAYFLPQMDALSEKYQLIYFDQRGMGRSTPNVDTATMHIPQLVADVEGIRQALGLEKIHLLGHSWGGLLAMHYAIAHQDKLHSLILMNSLGADRQFNDSAAKVMMKRFTPADIAERTVLVGSEDFRNQTPAALEKAYRMSFKVNFYAPEKWLDSLRLFVPADQAQRGQLLFPLYRDMQAYDLHPALESMNAPTLLLNGTYDATPAAVWDLMEKALPKVSRVGIDEAGHFPFIEAPDQTLKALTAFLNRTSPQS